MTDKSLEKQWSGVLNYTAIFEHIEKICGEFYARKTC